MYNCTLIFFLSKPMDLVVNPIDSFFRAEDYLVG